jgi:hypothetical protein
MKERVIKYIKTKFSGGWVSERIQHHVNLQEWNDLFEDSGLSKFSDEFVTVKQEIADDVLNELGFGAERFELETGVELGELICQIFPILEQ